MRARTQACRHTHTRTHTHTGTYTRTRTPPRRHAHSCVLNRNTEMQKRARSHTARRSCAHSRACAALCGAGGKLHSMVRVRELLGFQPDRTIVAGDSGGPCLCLRVCLPRLSFGGRAWHALRSCCRKRHSAFFGLRVRRDGRRSVEVCIGVHGSTCGEERASTLNAGVPQSEWESE